MSWDTLCISAMSTEWDEHQRRTTENAMWMYDDFLQAREISNDESHTSPKLYRENNEHNGRREENLRLRAKNQEIWYLIDPNFPVRPLARLKPIEPTYDPGLSPQQFDQRAFEFYKVQLQVYKSKLVLYTNQTQAFKLIISYIPERITAEKAVLNQKAEPNSYKLLKALKERLAPTDDARALSLEKLYEKLKKGPTNQDIETWVNDWQQM
ncbi:hypothetical protein MMC07_004438 [Pseudocyphellaria aurata]|nr:hypothetical protein [Pseudocyphellaria aurata]